VQHHVDEVLQDAGAGDRAVLGDVADDHQGDVAQLGHPDEGRGDLLDLGDTAGDAVEVAGADRLDGVDDEQLRLDRLHVPQHGAEVGLRRQVELALDGAGAVAAHPHLRGRLLTGDVEHALPLTCHLRGDLEEQCRLAHSGLTGQQDRGPGDQAATEHPVELGHTAGAGVGVLDRDLADGQGGRGDRTRLDPALGRRLLHDGAPRLALGAAPDPLHRLPAAVGAVVGGPRGLRR
jgi:hypothetical protein